MQALLAGAGLALVGFVLIDLLWTVLVVSGGGGPLTQRLSGWLWSLPPRGRVSTHRLLRLTGVAITLAVLGSWITLLWAGWALVFSSHPYAVVETATGAPADGWSRVYFAGYSVFTLGNGDFRPGGSLWQLAAVAAVGTGLTLITLAITYLMAVTSSAVQERQLATTISALGPEPEEVLLRSWDGTDFDVLQGHLQALLPTLGLLSQRLLAYPVLHYFHSPERDAAIAPSVAVLDDVLTLLEHAVAPGHRLPPLATAPVRRALTDLLRTLGGTFVQPADEPPPAPPVHALRRAGVPLVPDPEFTAAVDALAERRCLLRAYVEHGGWPWRRAHT